MLSDLPVITLEDFSAPNHEWISMNDPVMGGKSVGQLTIDVKMGVGRLVGEVVDVPFLHAPGFVKIETAISADWPDISSCEGLQLLTRSTTKYDGYRVSFGHDRPRDAFRYIYGYKANLPVPSTDEGVSTMIQVPFDQFTDDWDPETGDALVTCLQNSQYCPSEWSKHNLSSIAIWAEGVAGKVNLELEKIQAYGCVATTTTMTTTTNADEIVIEDFSSPLNKWTTMNDPVMGGRSKSSVEIHDGMASFRGTCAMVPFLRVPGFITMVTGGRHGHAIFPDVSNCSAFKLTLRTNVDYSGYYLSFGTVRVPGGGHASGYKVPLDNIAKDEVFQDIALPFSSFSSKWDEATGKIQVKCIDDPKYCPSVESLMDLKTMSFWGEGVEGDVSLDIQSIRAVGCASTASSYRSSLFAAGAVSSSSHHPSVFMMMLSALGLLLLVAVIAFRRRGRLSVSGGYQELSGHVEAV